MLYKKNNENELSPGLFKDPTCEYRGTPFWSWNCKLDKQELKRQIECLKEMGFGGFHIHSRYGLDTEYLSDEFMDVVRACADKAEKEQMLTWLYDEDRWPSGAAGGLVTKDPRFCQRYLFFTQNPQEYVSRQEAYESGTTWLLGTYDVSLDKSGALKKYEKIACDADAGGEKWYAYIRTSEPKNYLNGYPYLDTLSPEAVDEFIKVTHERYKQCVGDKFGKSIPAIFTDEPQFSCKSTLAFAQSKQDVTLPWTTDFDKTYFEAYGVDITECLPELIWELPEGRVSAVRYHYHDHTCERFTQAFADRCGKWCNENGVLLTGHMVSEPTLLSQTVDIGEAMRAYRSFTLPGIDMLCDRIEFSTAKQAQSAAHQYGYEGVLSELYGVTNWDFDFRGHKFQGDWQAALGITVRVHHLAWVSMKGASKRDYPASMNYQVPWYKEYSYIEDHFARLNTALTRGKPIVDVAVIHPIESYWLHWGPSENTAQIRKQLDDSFENTINWLLFGLIDFDFVSESLLPAQYSGSDALFGVGEMKYKTVIVPGCETLRRTTLKALEDFAAKGGRVIFMGECPRYIDALEAPDAQSLYAKSERVQFSKESLLSALRDERVLEIAGTNGFKTDNLLYTMRQDGDSKWLFVCNGKKPEYKDNTAPQNVIISIKGTLTPYLYDTMTGGVREIPYRCKDGLTIIEHTFYMHDSLLLRLENGAGSGHEQQEVSAAPTSVIDFKTAVGYEREEKNVVLLDLAEYSLDGGDYEPCEEILRIDTKLRELLGLPISDIQPWAIEKEEISHFVTLRYTFESDIEILTEYAFEEAEEIRLNGEQVSLGISGWYVDRAIKRAALPALKKGMNILEVKVPFGKRIGLESGYLLGDFDVLLAGCEKRITEKREKIAFGSIATQGMPFYGGNIKYKTKINVPACSLSVRVNHYRGALIKVLVDGKEAGHIVYDPYTLKLKNIEAGEHTLEFVLYGNRYNTFGSLHNNNAEDDWYGPSHWHSKGDAWRYEYSVRDTGILSSPVIEVFEG